MKLKSIASKLILSVLPIIAAFTLIFIFLTYSVSKSQMDTVMNSKMQESLKLADSEISLILSKSADVSYHLSLYAESCAEHFAIDAEDYENKRQASKDYLVEMVSSYDNIMGGGIWYNEYIMPHIYNGEKDEFYSHYVFFDSDENSPTYGQWVYEPYYSENGGGNFHIDEWYEKTEPGKPHWTGIYYDYVAKVFMITATFSIYDINGNWIGVTTADMSLGSIQAITSSIKIGNTGRALLLDKGGEYISFFDEGKEIGNRIQDDADENLAAAGKYMMDEGKGQISLKYNGVNHRVYFTTIEGTNWLLAVAVEESEISSTTLNSIFILMIVPIIGLLLSALSIWFMARNLTRVTAKVNDFAGLAAGGDFSKRIDVTENDEFGVMERNLNAMIENMQAMSNQSAKMLELAETASRSKSDFLSRMSHEIRTPMNAIIGMAQIAHKSDDTAKVADCLNKIDNASRHLLSLINDILDMSKIEANKLELVFAEFIPTKTLSNIYNFIAVKIEEKHQEFVLNVDKSIPHCLIGDELRFSQVITNLLSNAVKFTPNGGQIVLDVKQIEADDKYSTVEVSVSDNGIGMSEEQLSRIFKPFEQAESGISRKYGGTGLGLAICKSIIELAGGQIRAESKNGKGSKFIFNARFLIGATKNETDNADFDISSLRVLAVDDSQDILEYFSHLMSGMTIVCETAQSGSEALEKVNKAVEQNNPYDIIFMDYVMPVMDGMQAAEQIKHLCISSIIIMVSAYDLHSLVSDFEKAGISSYLPKPFSPSDIVKVLQEVACNKEKCKTKNTVLLSTDFSNYSVLVAEDVEINREIVSAALEETNIKVDFAVNGKEACDKYLSAPNKYDLILMDLQMPEMDGLQASRRIRETDKKIPIIAMTANAFKEDIDECLKAGMNGHLAKPMDFDLLIAKLREFLGSGN